MIGMIVIAELLTPSGSCTKPSKTLDTTAGKPGTGGMNFMRNMKNKNTCVVNITTTATTKGNITARDIAGTTKSATEIETVIMVVMTTEK